MIVTHTPMTTTDARMLADIQASMLVEPARKAEIAARWETLEPGQRAMLAELAVDADGYAQLAMQVAAQRDPSLPDRIHALLDTAMREELRHHEDESAVLARARLHQLEDELGQA